MSFLDDSLAEQRWVTRDRQTKSRRMMGALVCLVILLLISLAFNLFHAGTFTHV